MSEEYSLYPEEGSPRTVYCPQREVHTLYRSRETCRAMQWLGYNEKEIGTFLNAGYTYTVRDGVLEVAGYSLQLNNWIIIEEDGYVVKGTGDFLKYNELIPEPEDE